MPLPGERLVAFLSDGAFEEQRGSDWAPRWWRPSDCGLVAPIMIANGRRIDQRTTMAQSGGVDWFVRPPAAERLRRRSCSTAAIPAAFVWAILEMERREEAAGACVARAARAAVHAAPALRRRGRAEGLRLLRRGHQSARTTCRSPAIPRRDATARALFNEWARALVGAAGRARRRPSRAFQRHGASGRPRERDHALARPRRRRSTHPARRRRGRSPADRARPRRPGRYASPMRAVDDGFVALVAAPIPSCGRASATPTRCARTGCTRTLERAASFRVTDPEPGHARGRRRRGDHRAQRGGGRRRRRSPTRAAST